MIKERKMFKGLINLIKTTISVIFTAMTVISVVWMLFMGAMLAAGLLAVLVAGVVGGMV